MPVSYLIDSLGVGPLGDHVIQHAFTKGSRHLVQRHELTHGVEHLMVFGCGLKKEVNRIEN